jgi:hypothetical protein
MFLKIVLKSVFLITIVSVFSLFIVFPTVDAAGIDFQYQHKETWKNVGESSPPMLRGIVIDSNDNLYVIDSNQLLKLTTANEILWTVVFDFNLSGELFLNQNNEIFVVVSDEEIRKYSQFGKLVKTWSIGDFTSLDHSSFIYVDQEEYVYIFEYDPNTAKTQNLATMNTVDTTYMIGTIKKFDLSGNHLKTYEQIGLLKLKDNLGNLYTTEPGKIVKYDVDEKKISEFGTQEHRGDAGTFFGHADTIIVDSNGIIFATGGVYGPINIFDEEGNFSGIGEYGWGSKSYGHPMGIALDSQNNAYVTDHSKNYILVYERISLESASQNNSSQTEGGGCLIATATYGSEMAIEVQQLRELRDNTLLQTESGTSFMSTFNDIYYSFSPTIADMERESPVFKEIVKAGLTPMLSTLAIMENAESESEVLGLGLSVIALNLGMYIAAPALIAMKVNQQIKSRK